MRIAQISRKTKETDIRLELSLDGGPVDIKSGIGFFDHMLTALFSMRALVYVWRLSEICM